MAEKPKSRTPLLLLTLTILLICFTKAHTTVTEQDGGADTTTSLRLPLFHISTITNQTYKFSALRQRHVVRHGSGFIRPIYSGFSSETFGFFTRLGIGTPPQYKYLLLDTGSNLVWTQCLPCKKCYRQPDPIFNPTKSSSFRGKISCQSPICTDNAKEMKSPTCSKPGQPCTYNYTYGDRKYTNGELATETLSAQGVKIGPLIVGCSHETQLTEGPKVGYDGLIGLGKGELSFLSQTARKFNHKLTYCLPNFFSSKKHSYLIFGDTKTPRTAQFTPFDPNSPSYWYLVTLIGISVAGKSVPGLNPVSFKGQTLFDTGTPITRLPKSAYDAFEKAFLAAAAANNLKPLPPDVEGVCFIVSGKLEGRVPEVVFHFKGGADMVLPARNVLWQSDERKFCFNFVPFQFDFIILGSYQHAGFWVTYDVPKQRLGFAPGGCK